MTAANDDEFLYAIRAVSWVESQHGTSTGGNETGPHNPMQCGHPKDSRWVQIMRQTQQFDRFARGGTGSVNYDSWQLPATVQKAVGWNTDADISCLDDPTKGHGSAQNRNGYTQTMSNWWGVPHLIWKINVAAGARKAYMCGGVARAALRKGCVAYHGGGDSTYGEKILAAYSLFTSKRPEPAQVQALVGPSDARQRGWKWGYFESPPLAEWGDDGRRMSLERDVVFVDRRKKRWIAGAGATTDGASIPQALWSVIGGPYEGKYRNASVVHDTECQPPYSNPSASVHRMFYEACRAGGVSGGMALLMYVAVLLGGPRWTWPEGRTLRRPTLSEDNVYRAAAWVRAHREATPERVESFTVRELRDGVWRRAVEGERRRAEAARRKGRGSVLLK